MRDKKGNSNSGEVIMWLVKTHALTDREWRVYSDTEHKRCVFTVRRHGSPWLSR